MSNDLGYAGLGSVTYKQPVTVSWAQQAQDNITALTTLFSNYKQGVKLSPKDAATILVSTGSIMINNKLRQNTSNIAVTWSMTGGNTIAETSSTGYYIWAIASGSTSTFECGINQTATNMTGNANARLLGWFWNNTANAVEGCWTLNQDKEKKYESSWFNVNSASAYTLNHNMETWDLQPCTLFSWNASGTSPSHVVMQIYENERGCEVHFVTTNTVKITVGQDYVHTHFQDNGVSDISGTTGYYKLFLSAL